MDFEGYFFQLGVEKIISLQYFSRSIQSHSTTNPTGRTTTATECTCRRLKATARSATRTKRSTCRPRPTATPPSRSDSKPTPTTWTSTPPRGGLPTGPTSSPGPPTPGCRHKQNSHAVCVQLYRAFLWVFVREEYTVPFVWVKSCGCM